MGDPTIGVLANRGIEAVATLDDVKPLLDMKPLSATMTECYETDAHMVCYSFVPEQEQGFPRCMKVFLPRARAMGVDIVTTCVVLDWDLPHLYDTEGRLVRKFSWADDGFGRKTLDEWWQQLGKIGQEWPAALDWRYVYTTRHGLRVVYVFEEPVSVDKAEGHILWTINKFRANGLEGMDQACADWTRLFRLPFVMRGHQGTWDDPYIEIWEHPQAVLKVEDLGHDEKPDKGVKGALPDFDHEHPDDDVAAGLIEKINDETGRLCQTEWTKAAKKRLKNRDSYDSLFKHELMAQVGERNSTLMKYVGEVVTLCFRIEGTTPAHIYGLFLAPTQQIQGEDDGRPWTDTLWYCIGYCWTHTLAETIVEDTEKAILAGHSLDLLEGIVTGMREWCKAGPLMGGDAIAKEWAMKHLVVAYKSSYHIRKPNGSYVAMGVRREHMPARIRQLGMEALMPIEVPAEQGIMKDVSAQTMVNRHATIVAQARGQPQIPGCVVKNMDRDDACLVIPLFSRKTERELPPTFDKEVDDWLKAFFGDDGYEMGCKWIGHSLAFDEGPICALSIHGAAGCGKKLLVQGLAECITTECTADVTDLTSSFQPGLMSSPYLKVDEGWSKSKSGKHPADMFRELVGGGDHWVDRKWEAPVLISVPTRVIFTANSLNVVSFLTGGREMSPEDRQALGIRLRHMDVGDRATKWLTKRGGIKFTGKRGHRWIKGDANEPSSYVIAKHVMWLYQNRGRALGQRFLIEGDMDASIIDEMRVQSGSSPIVIETLVRMIENQGMGGGRSDGLAISDEGVHVLTNGVLQFFRAKIAQNVSEKLNAGQVGKVLNGLVEYESRPKVLKGFEAKGRVRWHKLDVSILLTVADNLGYPCITLRQIVKDQRRDIVHAV